MDRKELEDLQEKAYKDWQAEVKELVRHSGLKYDNPNQELLLLFMKDNINIIRQVVNDNPDVEPIFKTLITATCNDLDKAMKLYKDGMVF